MLLQYRLCKGNGQVLKVKDVKDMHSVNPLASLARFVSMANVSVKTKQEYGWVVENIKHLMTCPKRNS